MKNSRSCSTARKKANWRLGLAAIVLVSAGCASTRPIRYYQISVRPTPAVTQRRPHPLTLLVGRIESVPLLRDGGILYRVGAHEVNAYHYHRWVEPPDRVVQELLVQVLRSSGSYSAVQEQSTATGGDYVVRGKLLDFSEIDNSSIQVRVSIVIDLYNRKDGSTVWTHYYSSDEPVDGKDVQDVVRCLERNLLKGLNEIANALDQYFAHVLQAADHGRDSVPSASRPADY